MASEDDPATKAAGQDLVVISSTADPREIADKYADVAVPVFTWNTVDYPDMKLTGPERHVDFETLNPDQDYARSFAMLYGYFPNATDPIVKEFGGKTQLFGTLYLEPQDSAGASPQLPPTSSSTWKAIPPTPESSPTRRALPCTAASSRPHVARPSISRTRPSTSSPRSTAPPRKTPTWPIGGWASNSSTPLCAGL